MLSTSFIFKRLPIQDQNEAVTKVSWNKTDGWLAYGGEQGTMRILMIETVDSHDFNLQGVAARPSRISIDRKIAIHEGSRVTSLNWNENQEQITSGDVRGSVVVCEYKDSKWTSILVNESVYSPVVNAVWASDASKILIFYLSGQLLLGAATGHKILSVQIKQPDTAKFAFVSDSRHDFFVVGFETRIIGYNFDSSEKYKILIPAGEKIISGHLVESKDKEEPKVVVVTANGILMVFSAVNGMKLIQQQIQMLPSEIVVSPNNQYIAISGQLSEPHQRIDSSTNAKDAEHSAVLKLLRFCDLEQVAQIKIPSKIALSVDWDASSLRLAIGTENSLYLACLRLSYRHYMLRDGTVSFSLGSSILKTSSQVVKSVASLKDECIVFFKSSVHKRWPNGFIDQCACGEYLAMILAREQVKPDGTVKQLSSVVFHSSVGAPALTIDLNYIPFFMAGSEHYLVTANSSRISLFDIRFLSGETKDYQNIMESKLDAGQAYNGVVEWHADSSPFAPDRELHVAKASVSSYITSVCVSNSALFVARQNATIQRFNLPSLKSDIRIQTGLALKAIKSNCSGTALAGVTDEGCLHVFYTEDFIESEVTTAKHAKEYEEKIDRKKERKMKDIIYQEETNDDLTKMLGFDGEAARVDKKANKVVTTEKQATKVFPPWDTQLDYVWGIYWNNEDPNLLAVSSKHKILVLYIEKRTKEEPITSSAHLLAFKGLQVHGVYLDEMVMYGEPKEGSVKIFDCQYLRELKDILYGKQPEELLYAEYQEKQYNLITVFASEFTDMTYSYKIQVNLSAAYQYLKQQQACHPHLYKLVAEAALRELALDVASQFYIRAGDYISYHFAEYIRRIGSDELRRAEVAIFLGDFKQAEYILIKQLGRPDLSLKNDEQLGMWFKIIATHKDAEYNQNLQIYVSDELSTYAHKQAGLYYLRQRDYAYAVSLLQKANDTNLLTEAYYRAEMYDELRQLATTLQVDVNYDAIIQTSKVLSRIGDVEGATLALLRLNKPEDAIKVCITLKRFDKAILIAQEFNLLEVVDKHLSEYLRQLLSSGDDKAALDLLRKTNQGEIAACIIIGAAVEQLKEAIDQRAFPLKPGVFNRLRRLVVLAAKEATEVYKKNITKELKSQNNAALLTNQATDDTLNNLVNDNKPSEEKQEILDNQMFARFGNKVKSTAMIWKIVKQTRYIVLASYMLYMNKPEQALFPAIEASGFYMKMLQNVGNFSNVVDEEYRYLQKLALPIAILAALLIKDFDLASYLLEVLESDEQLPSVERDQLEQLAVDIFSKFPPTEQQGIQKDCQLQCEKCKTMLPKYCTVCSCGYQAQLCSRTGQPVNPKHKVQKCSMCGTVSTQGKAYLSVCPMCHENYE